MLFNVNRITTAILTDFSGSLISFTNSFHLILIYITLLGSPLPSRQREINLEHINNANELDLETATGRGSQHWPGRLLHSSLRIPGTQCRQSGKWACFSVSAERLSLAFTSSCELRHIFIFHKTKGRRGTTVFWLRATRGTCSPHTAKAFPEEHL